MSSSFQAFVRHSVDIVSSDFHWEDIPEEEYNSAEEMQTYSYTTDIASYDLCPRRYFFLRKISFPSLERENMIFGTLLHRCLERLHKYPDKIISLEEMIGKEKEKLEKKSKFFFQEEDIKMVYKILQEYQGKEVNLYDEILQAEGKEFLEWQGNMIYGEIDLLALQENQWKIIDFKTGKENPSYIEQLVLYQNLLRKYGKEKEIRLSLYYLLEQREEKIELSLKEEVAILEKIQRTIENIQKKEFTKREYQKEICDTCEFFSFCYRKETL